MSEVRCRRSGGDPMSDVRGQMSERAKRPRAGIRPTSDIRHPTSDIGHRTSDLCQTLQIFNEPAGDDVIAVCVEMPQIVEQIMVVLVVLIVIYKMNRRDFSW